jgi:purine-binding chemotaxis protein CheW
MESAATENSSIQLLVWAFNDTLFGVNMEHCLETKADVEIFPVPYAKSHIAGIANLRGEISVVYNLGILLDQKKRTFQNREMIVRLKINNKHFSVIVDSITEVIQESFFNLKSASSYLSKERCQFTSHVLDSELGLILILDLEKIYEA